MRFPMYFCFLKKSEGEMNQLKEPDEYITFYMWNDWTYAYKTYACAIILCVATVFESISNVQAMASNLLAHLTVLVTCNSDYNR